MSRFRGFDPERSSRCVCRGLIASVALDIKSRDGVTIAAGRCDAPENCTRRPQSAIWPQPDATLPTTEIPGTAQLTR